MVKRIVVGAHYGLRDWIAQRATAVLMLAYTVLFFVVVGALSPDTHDSWRAIFSTGFIKFATFLFFLSLFWHAWIGIRDIWMDYVKPTALRLGLMVVTVALLVGYAGWSAKILWSL